MKHFKKLVWPLVALVALSLAVVGQTKRPMTFDDLISMKRLADGGPREFYEGSLARDIAADLKAKEKDARDAYQAAAKVARATLDKDAF